MGISNSWFAVRGWARDEALAALGMEAYREIEDWPRGRFAIGELPQGWLLIIADGLDEAFEDRFVDLSVRGPAVACAVEEHVMYHEARGYKDGAEVWRVTHDPDKGRSLYHLEAVGDLPAAFDKIRKDATAQQDAEGGEDADVDYISGVPLDLAKLICGFKHDDRWPPGLVFTELRAALPARSRDSGKPGFFARLFGRG